MVKFLIKHPIAVSMTYIALFVLGIIAYKQLPVSLLPDVSIPEITVRVSYPSFNAREIENNITQPMRRHLKQSTGLETIESTTDDGQAIIKLRFDYGINIDYAAIEVNEIVDRMMNWFPDDLNRPRVIKASASDIPVFYLNLSDKSGESSQDFLDLSRFAQNVIRKRIEQLPEVGLVDITGMDKPQIIIRPDEAKLTSLGISYEIIEKTFDNNNISIGNILVNEGHYQYNIDFSSRLNSIDEIKNMYLASRDKSRLLQLRDIATIEVTPQKQKGIFLTGQRQAISMAIIKQPDAKMQSLKKSLKREINRFTNAYPGISFEITQDQTALLDYSISNLKSTLLIGAILAFVIIFLFFSNLRLPALMVIAVPVSVIISIMFLWLFNISINIISLSGLILGVGMMIDNSIIVIDNISQYRERGYKLSDSCVLATNEVIRPLLSSALTTSCVFIPLIFISGIAGALFTDQAITVTTALLVSFMVSITLLPVIYFVMYRNKKSPEAQEGKKPVKTIIPVHRFYDKGFSFLFKYKYTSITGFLLLVVVAFFLFQVILKKSFPQFTQKEVLVQIDWNENLSIGESRQRVRGLLSQVQSHTRHRNAWIGQQDYILNRDYELSASQTVLYLSLDDPGELAAVKTLIGQHMDEKYGHAGWSYRTPENIFKKTFLNQEHAFTLRILPEGREIEYEDISGLIVLLNKQLGKAPENEIRFREYLSIRFDREKLLLYGVPLSELYRNLRTAFNENEIGALRTYQDMIPVIIGSPQTNPQQVLRETTVENMNGAVIPVGEFISLQNKQGLKTIYAGNQGEYIPLHLDVSSHQAEAFESKIAGIFKEAKLPYHLAFAGSIYDARERLRELMVVLLISLVLLYFILAAQFESLWQPLIILLEVPMDIAGALLLLIIAGESLNIMSAIGIIVMSGIIINDSIIKVDTINRLRRYEGYSLTAAIHEGGRRRLRPIIMTSLTTILALLPFLFGKGIGTELQLPLALAVIGGLGLGTIVSLYFIPLGYWFIYRKNE